ncbi:hypothetical protein G5H96_002055 [Salmonella enterica subsp. enterica serovar Reading]|nr:hypothetical protein [Salmonella enterica]EEN9302008.1 hypothetical protein [Salmonella enterica subsp. enterica serovar Reading]EHL1771609.1 hypothetical protein [Salmonella enterica]EIZ4341869.1 hypothetical protein [Salmonella enterica subsp. enterica serovar Reading]QQH42245.1 hypothetical protein HFU35_24140 [Salmonella enterica subsp. enterica serovar Reading]
MSQFVLGLDIGYSNLKMAMGYKGEEARTDVYQLAFIHCLPPFKLRC